MTRHASITLDVFQQQVLPLLQSRHGQGAALTSAIKSFIQQTPILDEQGNTLDVDALCIESPADESEDTITEQRINQLVQRAISQTSKAASPRPVITSGQRSASGFTSLGEFALAVHKAAQQGGSVDPRLHAKSPSVLASESVGSAGGYLVPTEFSDRLWEIVFSDDSLLSRTSQIPTQRNSLSLPVSESTPWGASGVQAYWTDEGSAIPQSRPKIQHRNLRLHKLAALVPASDELVEDAAALDAFVTREAGRAIRFHADDAIINGDGIGKPLGIFNASALVTVEKETTQTTDTIVAANIAKMYSRMPASSMNSAIWLLSQDVLPQIVTLTLGDQPIYQPPTGDRAPLGTLLGRPIVLSQHCRALGDKGDIYFVNLADYVTLTRSAGIRTSSSIHLWFDHDVTAFRFTFRLAGQPWLSAPIASPHSSNTTSPFITLEAR